MGRIRWAGSEDPAYVRLCEPPRSHDSQALWPPRRPGADVPPDRFLAFVCGRIFELARLGIVEGVAENRLARTCQEG